MMGTTTGTCWADPLSSRERAKLARKLASACKRFYSDPAGSPAAVLSRIVASAEMADLHLDVTERAGLPAWEATGPYWRCPSHDQTLVYASSDEYDERWGCPVIGCAFARWVG